MSQYDPREAVSELKNWIGSKISTLDGSDLSEAKERYRSVLEVLNGSRILGIDVSSDLLLEKNRLESRIQIEELLRELQQDLSLLALNLKKALPNNPGNRIPAGKKGPRKSLTVTFRDGTSIREDIVANTFIRSLQYIGLERLSGLRQFIAHGHPLVSTQQNPNAYSQKLVDGFYIETHSGTQEKARLLRAIAKELGVDMKVVIG